jgi:uncharacterized protein YbbK (DUF523 family)
MFKILVSACLLGEPVRYNGAHKKAAHPALARWIEEGRVVSVCPEMLGGLPTPRPPAEIIDGGRVVTPAGDDVTAAFERGARISAEVAERDAVRIAILKSNSPSCGSSFVYDGTFTGTRVAGDGKTTAALRARGVTVFTEEELDAAERHLAELEGERRRLGG